MKRPLCRQILLLLILSVFSFLQPSSSHDIQILNAERRIDLTSHIVRVFLTLKVENIGVSPTSELLLALTATEGNHLSFLKAQVGTGTRKKPYIPLDINSSNVPNAPDQTKCFTLSLHKPLAPDETATIEVAYSLTRVLEPFPSEISQSESQLVYFRDSATLLSPYHIKKQGTTLKVPSARVEAFTKVEPTKRSGRDIKYGPFDDQPPFSSSPIVVHFENNNPFAVVEELVREVEISHWGSIQVTEHYQLVHSGARHKGVFSRLEYQAGPSLSGVSSFKHLLARLPPNVHSVYYRDEIGNISSSHLRTGSKKSELEIEPRYPLFGGWKTSFVIGYGLPSKDFVSKSTNGRRYLNFTFGCPLTETSVDKLIIKVVMPEGSHDPSAIIPFQVEQHLEAKYSYLEVIGRTVLVIEKENVVPEHSVPFQVYFTHKPVFMLEKPLILASACFLTVLAFVAYLCVDLSIRKQ